VEARRALATEGDRSRDVEARLAELGTRPALVPAG
jgi:hypothetical protein